VLPQPSAIVPQFAPACMHVRGVHGGVPQTPLTQGTPIGHGQLLTPPHPSATGPHAEPIAGAGHEPGMHMAIPHMFGPAPPHVPVMHMPQSSVPPQPSPSLPHIPAEHVFGVHAGAPHWLGMPPPPQV
jgi:hypothetical protein